MPGATSVGEASVAVDGHSGSPPDARHPPGSGGRTVRSRTAVRLTQGARWVLLAATASLPLAHWARLADPNVVPKLAAARLALVVAGSLWLVAGAAAGRLVWRRSAVDLPLLALIASTGLSTVLAENRTLALVGGYTRYEGTLTLLTYAGLTWVAVQVLETAAQAHALLRAMLVGGVLAAAWAVAVAIQLSIQGVGASGEETAFTFGGMARAAGTLYNPNLLGMYLAMLLPVAVWEFRRMVSALHRILAATCVLVLAVGLLLTFSRSAWLGATVGLVLALWPRRTGWRSFLIATAWMAALGVVGGVAVHLAGDARFPIGRLVASRALSIGDIQRGTLSTRVHIWRDALPLIMAHPVAGTGPDSFGLAFPQYETQDWTPGGLLDAAHAELLQVGATRGMVGVSAYTLLLALVARAAWRARRMPAGLALIGAWAAYQIPLQVNFSWLPVTVMSWLLLAGSVRVWECEAIRQPRTFRIRLAGDVPMATALAIGVLGCWQVAWTNGVQLVRADLAYAEAVGAEKAADWPRAKTLIAEARHLAPDRAEYAAEAGMIACRIHCESAQADTSAARADLRRAAQLGTPYAYVYRQLAILEERVGDDIEARADARRAMELDRFDPSNASFLDQVSRRRLPRVARSG
jgi:hypothetical protein